MAWGDAGSSFRWWGRGGMVCRGPRRGPLPGAGRALAPRRRGAETGRFVECCCAWEPCGSVVHHSSRAGAGGAAVAVRPGWAGWAGCRQLTGGAGPPGGRHHRVPRRERLCAMFLACARPGAAGRAAASSWAWYVHAACMPGASPQPAGVATLSRPAGSSRGGRGPVAMEVTRVSRTAGRAGRSAVAVEVVAAERGIIGPRSGPWRLSLAELVVSTSGCRCPSAGCAPSKPATSAGRRPALTGGHSRC